METSTTASLRMTKRTARASTPARGMVLTTRGSGEATSRMAMVLRLGLISHDTRVTILLARSMVRVRSIGHSMELFTQVNSMTMSSQAMAFTHGKMGEPTTAPGSGIR